MAVSYELAILGKPATPVLEALQRELQAQLSSLGLAVPSNVEIYVGPVANFSPSRSRSSAALCFQCDSADDAALEILLRNGVPIVPVASTQKAFSNEVPRPVQTLNGISLDKVTIKQAVAALLECAGLLPRQRRVFISYRRDHGTPAAILLHAELSARGFDVFLDTHKIHPGEYFQEVLWQRLCDCDVLLMLDTKEYFDSRWTNAEFGRAMARGLAFVRVGWPEVPLNTRAAAALNLQLGLDDFEPGASLSPDALRRVCEAVEEARTISVAMRYQSLVDTLADRVQRIGGRLDGVSLRRSIIITLPDGRTVAAYPALGVPTSFTLHDATMDDHAPPVAVVYDDVGFSDRNWRSHMDWLDPHLKKLVRLVPSYRSGWDFADWQT